MRMLGSFLISAPTIFMIFLLMAHLAPSNATQPTTPPWEPIDLPNPKFDDTLKPKDREPLPEEPQQPKMPIPDPESPPVKLPPEVTLPTKIDLPDTPDHEGTRFLSTKLPGEEKVEGSRQAIPWMITEPIWPLNAKSGGTTKFCFTVNADGSVSNIKLVESKPGRVFVRSARKALRKWKFRPEVENGVNVARDNMCYTMKFNLPEESTQN